MVSNNVENIFETLRANSYIQLFKYTSMFAAFVRHKLERQWEMWTPDGVNTMCHQKNQNPEKHLNKNLFYHFNGTFIGDASIKNFMSKILEVYFISLLKPTLSNRINSD